MNEHWQLLEQNATEYLMLHIIEELKQHNLQITPENMWTYSQGLFTLQEFRDWMKEGNNAAI